MWYLYLRVWNMTSKSFSGIYSCAHRLNPGSLDKEHLRLLIDISKIRSDKVAKALTDYFVLGRSRTDVCNEYNINKGYLSLKIKELQLVSEKVYSAFPYYR